VVVESLARPAGERRATDRREVDLRARCRHRGFCTATVYFVGQMSSRELSEPDWLARERDYEDDLAERGTIPELYEASAERRLDGDAQLFKGGVYDRSMAGVVPEPPAGEYASLTYREMREVVRHLAAGFREVGIDRGDRVGILADTRMEWAQADLALLAGGAVVTTVYTDSSPNQVSYLLGDPGATGVVVENETLLERVLAVEDDLDLEVIVLVDEPDGEYDREDIYTLEEIHEIGEAAFDEATYRGWLDETDPEDLASLIYTSGTTGKPKGVRLTHWNFRSNVHAIRRRAGPRADPDAVAIDADTTTISFLPLAHVFERLAGHFLMFGSGATVGYAESTDTITEDIATIRPHAGASVPRVYERIFRTMREQASESPLKARIFEWAMGVAEQYQRAERPGGLLRAKHALADRLVYSTVMEKLGGNIELFVSGGGSLSPDLCRIFNGMGLRIVEGYGLTETAPVVTVNSPEDIRPGTVGVPLVGVDIAIEATPEERKNLDLHDGNSAVGELLVRGPNVTEGYWERPGATESAFVEGSADHDNIVTPEGVRFEGGRWFRTGDLVERTPEGYLVIHDRLKQILVLDTGKNIAPQPIEGRFSTDERVEQLMVIGDDRKFIAALVVPSFEQLHEWADSEGIELPDDREQLIEDERVNAWIADSIERVNEDLEKTEKIKKFALVAEEWTPDNNMLTPSLKKRRRDILSTHEEKVREIYSED
jgi:long-chain acyl-CoA synthetase